MDSVFQLMASSVSTRDLESVRRNVSGVDFGLGQLFGEGEGNAAGAGTDVRDARICHHPGERQYGFYHVLGFWTRNQHGGADDKVHTPEFLVPGDVLRWDALYSLLESLIVARLLVAAQLALGMGIQVCALAVESEHEQEFGIHPRRRHSVGG